jgi:hypothetical protein
MTTQPVTLELDREAFGPGERLLARAGALRATAFRYGTGVAALRLENGAGSATFLPFQGQQIWRADFLGRELTMRSMFDEPRPTRDYLRTYGALFLHCGGTAMGNPGPTDTHPLHGELPNLPYDTAQLSFGEDAAGLYAELTGTARDTLAFHHDFIARPRLRLHEGATAFEAVIEIENRAHTPLPMLYLAHINFRPADGGVLVDAVADDRAAAIRQPPADLDAAARAYHRAIATDPAAHRTLQPGMPILPELVLTAHASSGADGWTHALHRRPDGSGDFVSYQPAQLPCAVRWMTRGPDQDALGLVLPATAPPDGLAAATANRQLVLVPPGGSYRADMRFGALTAPEAQALAATIDALRRR